MIVPATLHSQYEAHVPLVKELAGIVRSTLLNFCDVRGYAFVSRLKTLESLAEKIETGRFRRWSQIDDLFACTIIVPSLAHEQEVLDFCKRAFHVKAMKMRGHTPRPVDVFRFDSTRITAKLRRPKAFDPATARTMYDIPFEIQVKSAFEHAWSVATHDLAYKSRQVDYRRLRLAAQIKAAVEQLDTLILAFDEVLPMITDNPWPEMREKRKIAEMMDSLFEDGRLPSECRPQDMSRFCNNFYSLLEAANLASNLSSVLETLEIEITRATPRRIPRSISLFQYFSAMLLQKAMIAPSLEGHIWHVTAELTGLFPAAAAVAHVFDYSS